MCLVTMLCAEEVGVKETAATTTYNNGAHCGKNGWNSLWQKWVELTVARMGGTGVMDYVTKMGGTHCGKN